MKTAHIVVGLGFGDEGKGSWVDHLVRRHGIKYVVRFNGGAQASHHVVAPDDRVHGFHQFNSGSFVPDTHTIHSRFMLFDPEHLLTESSLLEANGVKNPIGRLLVSENAPVVSPFNRLLNQIQEVARNKGRHGSCGFGIGVTQNDVDTLGEQALYVRDLRSESLHAKLAALWRRRKDEAEKFRVPENEEIFAQLRDIDLDYYAQLFFHVACRVQTVNDNEFAALIRTNNTVWEGAQGVLLDQEFGFFPFCTRSTCTFRNAELLLKEGGFSGTTERIGLLRGYGTRHGAGPFPTESDEITVAPCHNEKNPWQGGFRVGWFDCVTARYALKVAGSVDTLAITNLDRLQGLKEIKIGTAYAGLNENFGTSQSITPLPFKKDLLTERAHALFQVTPNFEVLQGFEDRKGLLQYLNTLQARIGHPIRAFSDTTKNQKNYL